MGKLFLFIFIISSIGFIYSEEVVKVIWACVFLASLIWVSNIFNIWIIKRGRAKNGRK